MNGADSRQFILDRIKSALNVQSEDTRTEERLRDWRKLPRSYRQTGALNEARRLALFEERIRHYNAATFYSWGRVSADIARILEERHKRILIVPPAFPSDWLPNDFMFIVDENLSKDQLTSCDGVVTRCTLGIALTGTIVLQSSPEDGRRAASLIPDYHLCVLRKDDIVEFVPEAFRRLENMKTSALTFVSGPSATVDIEMTRVRGVHGPRTLDILIV